MLNHPHAAEPVRSAAEPIEYSDGCEVLEDNEGETQRELIACLLEISDKTFEDTALGLRSVHAKGHALLNATVTVLDVSPPYAQGLFAHAGHCFSAVARISTTPGDLLDDRVSTPRGFALKVIGVPGERLAGTTGATTQDFLLVNGPAFLAPTVKKFLSSLKLLASTTDKFPNLKRAFSAVLQGTERVIEAAGGASGTIKGLGGHPETHPLGETYFSQVPFLYGPYMAKWSIAPVTPALLLLKDAPVDLDGKPDGLRQAMVEYFRTQPAQWELRVQLCTDLEYMPIEDASVEWPEDASPFVAVAVIDVAPQPAWDAQRSISMDEGLAFSPWHGLAAHRPLGAINRVRRAAYDSSASARSSRGSCPVHEP